MGLAGLVRPPPRADLADAVETWERIALSFSDTRNRPWVQVDDFLDTLRPSDTVLDLACGNGRHAVLAAARGHAVVGIDASAELCRVARERLAKHGARSHVAQASATQLPLQAESVDGALFIAALHNIPGHANRRAALRELRRVLRPQGRALISVWARWQDRFVDHYTRELLLHVPRLVLGRAKGREFGDIWVPWGDRLRFYHLVSLRGLITQCKGAGFFIRDAWAEKVSSRYLPDNHFIVVEKPPRV